MKHEIDLTRGIRTEDVMLVIQNIGMKRILDVCLMAMKHYAGNEETPNARRMVWASNAAMMRVIIERTDEMFKDAPYENKIVKRGRKATLQ